ncbi:MAG: hypothetical protein ACD_15C00138G0007 [uncultured bacterium]|nr:MAG: hypothetical protein ACD_15C00138G0007 [uncultured bacterium]
MCYNCGCKKPNDAHDKEENITNQTIRNAAEAMGMNFEDSIKNMSELAEIEISEHSEGVVHGHGLDHDHDHDHSKS